MRFTRRFLSGVTLVAIMSLLAKADEPPLRQGQLEAKATHIVVGKVKGVYASQREKERGVTDYVIEIEVGRATKGEGPKEGEVLYMRCWKRDKKSDDPKVSNGQSRIPPVSQRVLAYLKRGRDGGYDILEPNGIDKEPTRD
jgi:hypothetical protein